MPTDRTARVVDVQALIDTQPLSGVQKLLLLLCFAVVAVDGFDTAIIGFIAPAIRAGWQLEVASLGPLFAAGLFGLMLGARRRHRVPGAAAPRMACAPRRRRRRAAAARAAARPLAARVRPLPRPHRTRARPDRRDPPPAG